MAVLAIAVVVGASVAEAALAATKPPCGPARAKTLASDRVARVYQVSAGVYGCASGSRRRYELVKSSSGIGRDEFGPVSLSGKIAAYGAAIQGVDTRHAYVVVCRLSDGQQLHMDYATANNSAPEFTQTVDRLVLKQDGSVAWTSSDQSLVGGPTELEVNKDDKNGHALLDSGPGVDVSSLRLHRSQLTWLNSGQTHAATLN